jgi:hypothetical protein
MGFILFIISVILTSLFFAVSLVFNPIYYIITFKWKTGVKQLNNYFKRLAISIDQFGNGATSEILNKILLKRSSEEFIPSYKLNQEFIDERDIFGFPFGDMDLTVSYVIGVNKYLNNLTLIGKLIERILNLLDRNHVEKALESQYQSDRKSRKRLTKPFSYYHR